MTFGVTAAIHRDSRSDHSTLILPFVSTHRHHRKPGSSRFRLIFLQLLPLWELLLEAGYDALFVDP